MDNKILDIGKIFINKDGSYLIYIGVKLARNANFKHKEKVKIFFYPEEKKIVIMPLD